MCLRVKKPCKWLLPRYSLFLATHNYNWPTEEGVCYLKIKVSIPWLGEVRLFECNHLCNTFSWSEGDWSRMIHSSSQLWGGGWPCTSCRGGRKFEFDPKTQVQPYVFPFCWCLLLSLNVPLISIAPNSVSNTFVIFVFVYALVISDVQPLLLFVLQSRLALNLSWQEFVWWTQITISQFWTHKLHG